MSFCVATIEIDERLRAAHGVFRGASLFSANQAREMSAQLMEEARQARDELLDAARASAEETVRAAEREGELAVQSAQTRVVKQADALFATLEGALASVTDGIRPLVLQLAGDLFDRLVLDATPQERVAAAYRRLLEEVPPKLLDAELRVHPDELPLFETMVPAPRWTLVADAKMARGACRVDAASGEWSAGFELAAEALRQAFLNAADNAAGSADEARREREGQEGYETDDGDAPDDAGDEEDRQSPH
jgi:flagellar biosynthesis/type III secretory pathway protein FliH